MILAENQYYKPIIEKVGSVTPQLIQKVGSPNPVLKEKQLYVPGNKILTKLSYTHIEQLLMVEDQLKRTFYELECIKGTWSVRELKRHINSLYYERSGLSTKPELLSELTYKNKSLQKPVDIIKNGRDENLFIHKYMIKLPSNETLEKYIVEELMKQS